jgi:hypothetical protein
MSEPVVIHFLQPWHRPPLPCYAAGEVAGFAPEIASELLAEGIAERHDSGLGPGVPSPAGGAGPEPWRTDPAFTAVLADEAKAKRL